MNQNQKVPSVRWFYLIVGVIAMLFAGILYAWSILKAPFAEDFGWTPSQLALNFTVTMCFFCLGGFGGSFLAKKWGFTLSAIFSGLLTAAGFVLTSGISGSSVLQLYFTYGFLAGTGIGIAYNVIISVVSAWFPDKKGLCSGCLMMGFGASALVLGKLADTMMTAPALGWRSTYVILGCTLGTVIIIAALVLKAPTVSVAFAAKQGDTQNQESYTTAQMCRRPDFWMAFCYLIGLIAVGSCVISAAKDLAVSVGATLQLATTLVGVLSVFNGVGRILTGILFDTCGQRKTMLIANLLTILAVIVLLAAVWAHSVALCVVGLCLTGMSYGSCPTTSAALISTFYGMKHFSSNLAVMNLNLIFGSLIATVFGSLMSASGGYIVPFLLLLFLTLLSFVLNLFLRRS